MNVSYNYSQYTVNSETITKLFSNSVFLGIVAVFIILNLILFIAQWKTLKKLGKPGWALLIPIYSSWVYLECGGLPGWLVFVPVANAVGMVVATIKIPSRFGKGIGFGIGNLFFPYIFTSILGFGSAQAIDQDSNEAKTEENPDLMAPNQGEIKSDGTIDLMATPNEPAAENVETPVAPTNEFTEAPALDISEAPAEPAVMEMPQVETQTEPVVEVPSAFDMPMPAANNTVINNEMPIENVTVPEEPVVETSVVDTPVSLAETLDVPVTSEPVQTIEALNLNGATTQIEIPETSVATDPNEQSVPVMPMPSEAPTEITEPETPAFPVIEDAPETLNSIEDDIKEATIELPKMVNAEINENITTTKKCPFCGSENEYSSKTCVTCGNSLN